MNNKTEVSGITPEELLSRVKTILEKTIKETIQPKPEEFVGVPEVAKFCNESPRWVYLKCKEKFLRYVKTGKNASLKFKLSEVAEVMEKYRVESSKTINYEIDNKGNIISQ
tara:strand:- start:412 stop:744 length:333 start_codon:yes stop_codon:yes gene_type:complete